MKSINFVQIFRGEKYESNGDYMEGREHFAT